MHLKNRERTHKMSSTSYDPSQYRILIVDDEPDVRLLLTREISDHGYQVTSAGDVTWALEELHKAHIDVVFSDVRLPDRDGLELLANIKERFPDTEVVMMSGYSSMEAVGKALRLGAFDYLSKPLGDINIVTACIKRAIDKVTLQRSVQEHIQKLEEKTRQLEQEIGERKRIEKDLIEARGKAEHLAEAKSQFLANMSHEIRTPMNGVIGMTALLLRTELSDRQRRYVDTVRRSGDSLLTIIDDILDFSKVEAGKIELQNIDFNIARTLEDVTELLAPEAHRKQLQLMCHIPPGVPRWVKGDPGRLRQIITNLAGNALKFTDQGEVVIETELVEDASTYVTLKAAVRDTGIGIAEEHQKDLFDSFTQVDETNTRKYGGTGLGLAISKQLVELMGGEIGVTSSKGTGSTFWFTMPFRKSAEAPSLRVRDVSTLKDSHILLIDDNETMLQILREQTSNWGMEVEFSRSGIDAVHQLSDCRVNGKPVDVVLVDMQLPGMDGLEFANRVRQDPQNNYLPIIMATAFPKRGDAERAIKAGISAYLPKPIREAELRDCLVEVLENKHTVEIDEPELVTRHSIAETSPSDSTATSPSALKILIAEDNLVNQEVTRELLIEIGYDNVVVDNGQQALDVFKKGGVAGILMDCQMPVMTGQEATIEIRRFEQEQGLSPVPIIALTANAMAEDKRSALESGMNDFLTKPVGPDDLEKALAKWVNIQPGQNTNGADPKAQENAEDVLETGVRRSDRVIELFLKDLQNRVPAISKAIERNDALALTELAHGLKGSSLQIGAPGLAAIARDLESVGATTQLGTAGNIFQQLSTEVRRVESALQQLAS